MSRIGNQQRTLEALLEKLRAHWRTDSALPGRIERLLNGDRRFGSRDRRLYRELIFTALRYLPWAEPLLETKPAEAVRRIAWLAADSAATRSFRAELCSNLPPCPAGAAEKAKILGLDTDALMPGWLREECPEAFAAAQRDVLLTRAPLWLRLQAGDPATIMAEFADRGWNCRGSELLPGAFALPPDADVASTEAYRRGLVEIQDIGSQLVLESAGIERGGRWLDACAGAGGKTLQLALLLGACGHVDAQDLRSSALDQLRIRVRRAALTERITVAPGRGTGYDGVLVDAPCSGSGTWRRAPHLKWTTTTDGIKAAARLQSELLAVNSRLVRPGGLLLYATCSLCRSENENVVGGFLAAHTEFEGADFSRPFGGEKRGAGLYFWPAAQGGDGFFTAALRRRS